MVNVHWSVILAVMAVSLLYEVVAIKGGGVLRRQALAFFGALLVVVLALNGPVDALADHGLFTAHMVQHLLLALVFPPLLLLGTPDWMIRPLVRRRSVFKLFKFVTHPVIAFVLYNGFLAALHTPLVFEQMLRDESVHITLHLVLIATGILMWWPLLSPLPEVPRLSYPAQTLYLFLTLIPMAAVSAPITFADEVIYPWYLEMPNPLGLTPLADQTVGGLIMWVGSGLYLMAVFSMMFFRWARHEDSDEPSENRFRIVPSTLRGVPNG